MPINLLSLGLRHPPAGFITPDDFAWAVQTAEKKKKA